MLPASRIYVKTIKEASAVCRSFLNGVLIFLMRNTIRIIERIFLKNNFEAHFRTLNLYLREPCTRGQHNPSKVHRDANEYSINIHFLGNKEENYDKDTLILLLRCLYPGQGITTSGRRL